MPTATVALPSVGIVTVCVPVIAPKAPSWPTVRLTDSGAVGDGVAVTVNWASPPSVTSLPAVTLTSGSGGPSLSATPTEAVPSSADTV